MFIEHFIELNCSCYTKFDLIFEAAQTDQFRCWELL